MSTRHQFLYLAALALPTAAAAQAYPSRAISLVVPFAAGGAGDTVARVVVEQMREPSGQPVVIENVTGADGTIGTIRAARAKPDGYTLCLGTTGTHVLNGAFYSLPYDVLNGFVPVAAIGYKSPCSLRKEDDNGENGSLPRPSSPNATLANMYPFFWLVSSPN